MKILALETERFRNLPDRTWTFDPALQIILGPNEAGKSALHEAIRIALFASATSRDQRYLQARRWGAEDGIRLALHIQGPEGVYQILRDFSARKNALILPNGTRRPEPDLLAFLQQHLRIPTEAAFLATACVQQDELIRVRQDEKAVQPLLEQHALGGTPVPIADLAKKLERHLTELRRGIDKPAPANPGPIRQLRDSLAALRAELADLQAKARQQARAAEDLATARQELQTATEELRTKRDRLDRHQRLLAAEEGKTKGEELMRRALAGLTRIAQLEATLPGLRTVHARVAESLATHTARLAKTVEHHRLSQAAETTRRDLAGLTADLEALGRIDAQLADLDTRRQALPLTLEDIQNLRALPGEIHRLADGIRVADEQRATQAERKAAAERELAAIQQELAALPAAIQEKTQALAHAKQRIDLQAAREKTAADLTLLQGRLDRVRPLAVALDAKTAGRAILAIPDPLAERLPQLETQIDTYRTAMADQTIEVQIAPRQPLDLTTRTDAEEAQRRTTDTLVHLRATRRAEIAIDPWVDLTIENGSGAAHTLTVLEAERDALLAAAGCASVAEAHERLAARARLDDEVATLDRQLLAELGKDTIPTLEAALRALQAEQEKTVRALTDIPAGEEGVDAIQIEITRLIVEQAAQTARAHSLQREIETLTRTLAADPVATVRDEVQRKQDALAGLSGRLDAQADPDRLEALHHALDSEYARQEGARATTLDGRRLEDIRNRRTTLGATLAQLGPQLEALAPHAMSAEGYAAAQAALADLTQAAKDAERAFQEVETERKLLDRPALEKDQVDAAVTVGTANKTIAELRDFRLAPDDRLALERRVADLEEALPGLQKQVILLEERSSADGDLLNRIADREERLAALERQLRSWELRLAVDEQIGTLIQDARGRALADLSDRILPATTGRYLARCTGNRHTEIRTAGEEYQVWSPAKGGALTAEEFSSGTRDQFYLALRLAYLEALFTGERPPLLLDDPLVHCDPARRAAVLQLLAEYAAHGQVLLFSCHPFEEYQPFNVLTVG